jgi:hypothetical protein
MPGISSKWKRIGMVVVVLVATFSLSVAVYAQQRVQDKTFVVIGSSKLQGANIQAARDRHLWSSDRASYRVQIYRLPGIAPYPKVW